MRVLVTGAGGFVGGWLTKELRAAGHEVIGPTVEELDVTDPEGVRSALERWRPDAVAHLAAVSFGPDAEEDPRSALRTTVGGTANVMEAARQSARPPSVLVTGSSEVYGRPSPRSLPLSETAQLGAASCYSLTKLAQESVALAHAARYDLVVVATRSFNHAGPGQRSRFVVPALAERIRDVRRGDADEVRVGNLDVRRDFTDVRDVVRAYRSLLELMAAGGLGRGGRVFNVCSGVSTSVREILDRFAALAGIRPTVRVDPALVRANDATEIRGDAAALHAATGWKPLIALEETLADVWDEVAGTDAAPTLSGAARGAARP